MNIKINLPRQVQKTINILNSNGYEAYVVGGCVRDSLMGMKPADFDITTSATPEEIKKAFEDFKCIDTGIKHGTVTVLIDGSTIEITTFRTETSYADGRHPDCVLFSRNLNEDLIRRDLTINAMAYNQDTGLVDICGGSNDLENRIIRAVGDPYTRFHEDGLRVLRALRFAAVYDFAIDKDTSNAIHNSLEMLNKLSEERIFSELKKMLCGKNIGAVLAEYPDVICKIIPELAPSVGFDQQNPHHIYDVYTHTLKTVENIPPEPALRLAALLHDAGKPETFSVTDGVGHFFGHSEASVRIAEQVLKRLKSDSRTAKRVITLIKYHDPIINPDEKTVRRKMRQLTPEVLYDLLDLKSADNLAQAPECAGRLADHAEIKRIMAKLISENVCFSLRDLAVNGDDLKELGFAEGRIIGTVLSDLLGKVIKNELKNEKVALLNEARKHLNGDSNRTLN